MKCIADIPFGRTGYIAAMAQRAGEDVQTKGIGKTEASKKIGELKEKTGM